MNWQPIETAPDGIFVMFSFPFKSGRTRIRIGCLQKDPEWLIVHGTTYGKKPTHWMPLPEPPK